MQDRFRIQNQLVRKLEELGVSATAVLRRAGLPAGLLERERILVSTEELFAFWHAIADCSPEPDIGLRLSLEQASETHDPATIAALCSRTYADALQRVAHYKQLCCPEEVRILRDQPGQVTVEFAFLLGQHQEPPALVDLCLAWILALGRRGTGLPLQPLAVELRRSEVAYVGQHFQCPVHFLSDHNRLILSQADVERPFVTQNAQLLGILAPQLEAEINARQSLQVQVKWVLQRLLAGHRPRLPEVAEQLCLTPRTLQRRLTEAGLSFQRLLEEARRELAHHYLSQSRLELRETAYLLGFDDANSFFRAFQRWEGTSPGQWRAQHSGQLATA